MKSSQDKSKILREVLESLSREERLIWWHKGPDFSHFEKDVPFMIEFVNEGEVPYIQTVRLDTLEKYPLRTYHLLTEGIFLGESRDYPVHTAVRSNLGENSSQNTNFCIVPKQDVESYIKKRRVLAFTAFSELMEKIQTDLKNLRTFEKRAAEFGEDNEFYFEKIFL
jgi:hypothetical protein